jgi:type III secretion HrpO family protein
MGHLAYAGNKALWLILVLSAGPIILATVIGLLVALVQGVANLQEQTLPFGVKLLSVSLCLFAMSGWLAARLQNFTLETFALAFG